MSVDWLLTDMHRPAEDGVDHAQKHGLIEGGVGPFPEPAVSLAVSPQQIARDDTGLGDPQCQGRPFHAVLHRQHALFEQFALRAVRRLGGVLRHGVGLLGEGEIAVARSIGRLQTRDRRTAQRQCRSLAATSRRKRPHVRAAV